MCYEEEDIQGVNCALTRPPVKQEAAQVAFPAPSLPGGSLDGSAKISLEGSRLDFSYDRIATPYSATPRPLPSVAMSGVDRLESGNLGYGGWESDQIQQVHSMSLPFSLSLSLSLFAFN